MEPLALHFFHEENGALFTDLGGREAVLHYGSPHDEALAARLGAALFDLSFHEFLAICGPDREAFFQGMTTQDVRALRDGGTAHTLVLTPKGRMVSDARVLKQENELLLEVEPGRRSALADFLSKHVVSEEVSIAPPGGGRGEIGLYGPEAKRLLSELLPGAPWPEPGRAVLSSLSDGTPIFLLAPRFAHGADLLFPRGAAEQVAQLLTGGQKRVSWRLAGFEALESLRVEAGLPRFGVDTEENTLPLEAGYEGSISYTKGCYVGQEVIARATYRGQVHRRLVGLVLQGAMPLAGAELTSGSRKVGRLTSVARKVGADGFWALGYVDTASRAPGTRLSVLGSDTTAEVRPETG